MRVLASLILMASFFAMPLMAAPQAHGGGGGHMSSMPASMPMNHPASMPASHDTHVNHDAHGDAVSAQAKAAKAADQKVGPSVRTVAHDKSHGKGLSKTNGKGH